LGLHTALRAALDPARGSESVLVVGVDWSGSPPEKVSSLVPDAAVALLVGPEAPPVGGSFLDDPPGTGPSSTAGVFLLARERRSADATRWTGDWDVTLRTERPEEATRPARPALPTHGPVSQGAYVPRPRYLENLPSRWRFAGERCGSCGAVTFPARGRCRQCAASDHLEAILLPRDGGEVIASTIIRPGGQPTEFDEQVESSGPYGVVLVELAPGVRVTLQVADAPVGDVGIGALVGTRLRRLYPMEGEWRYGRKAVPLV
jgi:uncharacterized OB-fold protein